MAIQLSKVHLLTTRSSQPHRRHETVGNECGPDRCPADDVSMEFVVPFRLRFTNLFISPCKAEACKRIAFESRSRNTRKA